MSRIQIAFEPETQRRAHQRAADLGVSFAEYIRCLVARDLSSPQIAVDPNCVFDIGTSGGSNIATDKDAMIAAAFNAKQTKDRRR